MTSCTLQNRVCGAGCAATVADRRRAYGDWQMQSAIDQRSLQVSVVDMPVVPVVWRRSVTVDDRSAMLQVFCSELSGARTQLPSVAITGKKKKKKLRSDCALSTNVSGRQLSDVVRVNVNVNWLYFILQPIVPPNIFFFFLS